MSEGDEVEINMLDWAKVRTHKPVPGQLDDQIKRQGHLKTHTFFNLSCYWRHFWRRPTITFFPLFKVFGLLQNAIIYGLLFCVRFVSLLGENSKVNHLIIWQQKTDKLPLKMSNKRVTKKVENKGKYNFFMDMSKTDRHGRKQIPHCVLIENKNNKNVLQFECKSRV